MMIKQGKEGRKGRATEIPGGGERATEMPPRGGEGR